MVISGALCDFGHIIIFLFITRVARSGISAEVYVHHRTNITHLCSKLTELVFPGITILQCAFIVFLMISFANLFTDDLTLPTTKASFSFTLVSFALELLLIRHQKFTTRSKGHLFDLTLPSALIVAGLLQRKKRKAENGSLWVTSIISLLLLTLEYDYQGSSLSFTTDPNSAVRMTIQCLIGCLIAVSLALLEGPISIETHPGNVLGLSIDSLDKRPSARTSNDSRAFFRFSLVGQLCMGLTITYATQEISSSIPGFSLLFFSLQTAAPILLAFFSVVYLHWEPLSAILALSLCSMYGIVVARGPTLADLGLSLCILLAVGGIIHIKTHSPRNFLLVTCVMLACLFPLVLRGSTVRVHPLHALQEQSGQTMQAFMSREANVVDLQSAVADYVKHYDRLPPPGFDRWYKYAKSHGTVVLSNYDQINRDLAPFWHVQPAIIRDRTYNAVQDRYNYLAPLVIRKGKVTSPAMEQPTHYWLLETLMDMMQDFVAYLPDMDIAVNLNDEARVLAASDGKYEFANTSIGGDFTLNSSSWATEIPFTDRTHESFVKYERRLHNTFDHVTRFCPRQSLSRAHYIPTSVVGTFHATNGKASLDLCNYPQLMNTRGYFVSPTSYDVTDELLPVFSQSKPSTFSDILYPSPWNYRDKVGPDAVDNVPWDRKFDRIHWRGTTSEGWAVAGSWKRMLRQSMVDLLGGIQSNVKSFMPAKVTVYEGSDAEGYQSKLEPVKTLQEALSPDAFLVEINRAEEADVDQQKKHFELLEPNEFKVHWDYRYLLDADGAGFSGRFLSFMESQSLPLKVNSIFTEWWTDRVIAHQHFVPVTLASIYSTWTYFVGLKDKAGVILVEEHQVQARKIADDGRQWAKRALRKQDMKLYLWRLLLEYGRVVDDERDSIGYKDVSL